MAINVWWLWISFQPTLTYQSTQGWVTPPPMASLDIDCSGTWQHITCCWHMRRSLVLRAFFQWRLRFLVALEAVKCYRDVYQEEQGGVIGGRGVAIRSLSDWLMSSLCRLTGYNCQSNKFWLVGMKLARMPTDYHDLYNLVWILCVYKLHYYTYTALRCHCTSQQFSPTWLSIFHWASQLHSLPQLHFWLLQHARQDAT